MPGSRISFQAEKEGNNAVHTVDDLSTREKNASIDPNMRRSALHATGLALVILSFQALGIIYSDIGTSPLYVLNGIWTSTGPAPDREDIIGGISAIVWALTLMPLLKYVIICLYFGTHEGEGGTFALYQGLYPPRAFETAPTRDSMMTSGHKMPLKAPHKLRWVLLAWSLFGTALTMADGVFTCAVSVTSAVGGIAVAKESVASDVTGISIAFIVVLFIAQPLGTSRLAFLFAPITFLWLLLIAGTGIANIITYPGIWRAYDPSRAILYFVRTGDYDILAGVLLAVTGCEALFANLGQFNAGSIRISFLSVVYPSLILAYLGQGSRVIVDGDAVISNIFYKTIPGSSNGPLFWIMYVFAILATLIASQAMITGTFSLTQQLVNMKSLPPLRMKSTSEKLQGQVYIPAVNWILMIATIIVVAAFKSSAQLTNAYGFAVATVMFTTTILIAIQCRYVKQLPIIIGLAYFVFFGFIDGIFWGAALKKVPEGAWVPLMLGIILWILMFFWTWAKGLEERFDYASRLTLDRFISTSSDPTNGKNGNRAVHTYPIHPDTNNAGAVDLSVYPDIQYRGHSGIADVSGEAKEGNRDEVLLRDVTYYCTIGNRENDERGKKELGRLPVLAVFHRMAHEKGVPHSFISFIRQWPALPRVIVFLSVHTLPIARVELQDRYVVSKIESVSGFYGVSCYLGFREEFQLDVSEVVQRICGAEAQHNPRLALEQIQHIKDVANSCTHVIPHYDVLSRKLEGRRMTVVVNYIRKFLIEDIYARLLVMFPETANWLGSPDEIIRIGVNARI